MKQVKSFLKIFSLGLLLVGGAACTGNFDEINRKEYEVTKDEQGRENYNIGSTLRGLQGLVVPTKRASLSVYRGFGGRSVCRVLWDYARAYR